jgi:hypothetical protein
MSYYVTLSVDSENKIGSIKELRLAFCPSLVGLKEAKETIEWIITHGWGHTPDGRLIISDDMAAAAALSTFVGNHQHINFWGFEKIETEPNVYRVPTR